MPNRVSQIILLCEDEAHERLAKAYFKAAGLQTQAPYVNALVASRLQFGGNDAWVLQEFPRQLHACRQRNKRAKTLLVVLIDADQFSVDERRQHLLDRLGPASVETLRPSDPVVIVIPKRHVETWIRVLLGEVVTEEEDCMSRAKPTKDDLRRAAQALFAWSRLNATPGANCVQSLLAALPGWKQIG